MQDLGGRFDQIPLKMVTFPQPHWVLVRLRGLRKYKIWFILYLKMPSLQLIYISSLFIAFSLTLSVMYLCPAKYSWFPQHRPTNICWPYDPHIVMFSLFHIDSLVSTFKLDPLIFSFINIYLIPSTSLQKYSHPQRFITYGHISAVLERLCQTRISRKCYSRHLTAAPKNLKSSGMVQNC